MSSVVLKTRFILLSSSKKFKPRWRNYSNISYMHYLGSEPLRYMTMGNLLEDAATKYRDRPSVISRYQKKTVTFGDILEEADRLAAGLLASGLKRGDRVGLYLPNRYEWSIVFSACTRAELILVALNPAYQAAELEYCINKVGAAAIICCDKFKSQDYYEILNRVSPEISKSEPGKIRSNRTPTLKTAIFMSEHSFKGVFNYDEILNMGDENMVKNVKNGQHLTCSDSPGVIQFSSGTTGKPKAAVISHFSLVNNSYNIGKRVELNEKHHISCLPNPLFHAYGLVIGILSSMHFGTTIVLPGKSYNPDESLDAIKEEKCTILYGTPTMHVDLIEVQSRRQENIDPDIIVTGGAPCSPHLFRNMINILKVKKVKSIYGLSETTAALFHSMENDDEYHSTSTVGHLGEHLEAKVIDSEGRTVPFGQIGELCVRGYVNMLEYWGDVEKTKETIGADGWLRTGDLFILEKSGYGKIVGRSKDMIIRGGENIYPKEIEEFLNTHPDIIDSQVIGVPHERLGEEVCAFVRLKNGKKLTHEQLIEFSKGNIAHFKIPSHLRIVDDFPKTASGKIQKFKLRELFQA